MEGDLPPVWYFWISMVSAAFFAWIGIGMARRRERTPLLWGTMGALFPPLLILLKLIHWRPRAGADQTPEADPGEAPADPRPKALIDEENRRFPDSAGGRS